MTSSLAAIATGSAAIIGAQKLGAALYEAVVVDRAWLDCPAIIQSTRGGLDRKRYWIFANSAFELSLGCALWIGWPDVLVRLLIGAALVSHGTIRLWSFAYFIPRALEFESATGFGPWLRARAKLWIILSRCRLILDALAVLATASAALVAICKS